MNRKNILPAIILLFEATHILASPVKASDKLLEDLKDKGLLQLVFICIISRPSNLKMWDCYPRVEKVAKTK